MAPPNLIGLSEMALFDESSAVGTTFFFDEGSFIFLNFLLFDTSQVSLSISQLCLTGGPIILFDSPKATLLRFLARVTSDFSTAFLGIVLDFHRIFVFHCLGLALIFSAVFFRIAFDFYFFRYATTYGGREQYCSNNKFFISVTPKSHYST